MGSLGLIDVLSSLNGHRLALSTGSIRTPAAPWYVRRPRRTTCARVSRSSTGALDAYGERVQARHFSQTQQPRKLVRQVADMAAAVVRQAPVLPDSKTLEMGCAQGDAYVGHMKRLMHLAKTHDVAETLRVAARIEKLWGNDPAVCHGVAMAYVANAQLSDALAYVATSVQQGILPLSKTLIGVIKLCFARGEAPTAELMLWMHLSAFGVEASAEIFALVCQQLLASNDPQSGVEEALLANELGYVLSIDSTCAALRKLGYSKNVNAMLSIVSAHKKVHRCASHAVIRALSAGLIDAGAYNVCESWHMREFAKPYFAWRAYSIDELILQARDCINSYCTPKEFRPAWNKIEHRVGFMEGVPTAEHHKVLLHGRILQKDVKGTSSSLKFLQESGLLYILSDLPDSVVVQAMKLLSDEGLKSELWHMLLRLNNEHRRIKCPLVSGHGASCLTSWLDGTTFNKKTDSQLVKIYQGLVNVYGRLDDAIFNGSVLLAPSLMQLSGSIYQGSLASHDFWSRASARYILMCVPPPPAEAAAKEWDDQAGPLTAQIFIDLASNVFACPLDGDQANVDAARETWNAVPKLS